MKSKVHTGNLRSKLTLAVVHAPSSTRTLLFTKIPENLKDTDTSPLRLEQQSLKKALKDIDEMKSKVYSENPRNKPTLAAVHAPSPTRTPLFTQILRSPLTRGRRKGLEGRL